MWRADSQWQPVLILIITLCIFQAVGPQLLRYETVLLHHQQWWRVLTGHWVHANWTHFGLNMAGFLLCVALTEPGWKISQWLWRIILLSLGISLLLIWLKPNLGWYVGFSGVLFGLYVLTALTSWQRQKLMSSLLLAVIASKLIIDLWSSVKITTSELIGVPVLVEAHLYGVLVALLIALSQLLIKFILQTKSTGNS